MDANHTHYIAKHQEEFTAIRRDLHAHPELGFEEHRTARVVQDKLASLGIEHHTGIGKTGIVAVIPGRSSASGRAVGLRADMDCLPMDETNTFAHRSIHKGRMHACGHDGHTAMLLGAARYLAATRNFQGTVHLIFQPAEEGPGGARVMIEEGLFEKFPCEAVFAMHNWPSLDAGKFLLRPGPLLAGAARFDIRIKGKGAHGARPETGIDPIVVASHIVAAAQSIVARNLSPHDTTVLSITQFHAGDAYNVIPETAVLRGTIRAFRTESRDLVIANLKRISSQIAAAFGAEAVAEVKLGYPPLVNDATEAAFISDVAAGIVGEENVERNAAPIMGSEDFSFMLEKVPGAFIMIGQGGVEGGCEVHNPGYDFNDQILPLGATLFARLVETRLAKAA